MQKTWTVCAVGSVQYMWHVGWYGMDTVYFVCQVAWIGAVDVVCWEVWYVSSICGVMGRMGHVHTRPKVKFPVLLRTRKYAMRTRKFAL